MAATVSQVSNYISYIRDGIAEFTDKVQRKEQLGKTDLFCERQKVMLLSAYLDCVVDYFDPYILAGVDDYSYADNNFFDTDEIRDVMQHINNMSDTFYMLEL